MRIRSVLIYSDHEYHYNTASKRSSNRQAAMLRLSLFVFLLIVSVTSCCESSSFQNARVIVYESEKDLVGNEVIVNGCLTARPEIKENSRIECKYQNINTLNEGAVANLSSSVIVFNSNGLENIKPGAFQDLDLLSKLDMNQNRIKEIHAGVFSPLLSLEVLSLENNQITKIHNRAFANLANLKEILLVNNKMTTWDNSWFRNNFALRKINLNDNLITYIPDGAIKGLKQLRDIHLRRNKIVDLHPGAFPTDELYTLDLSENGIKKLHPDLFASFRPKEEPPKPVGNNRFQVIMPTRIRSPFAGIQNLYLHKNNLTYLPQQVMNDLSVHEGIFYINLHSNPWQCPCFTKIQRWVQRMRGDIDVFNIGCVDKRNPICVVTESPECVEQVDEEIYKIYYSQYREVDESNRFDSNVRCF